LLLYGGFACAVRNPLLVWDEKGQVSRLTYNNPEGMK
jgi:hypothetical protein